MEQRTFNGLLYARLFASIGANVSEYGLFPDDENVDSHTLEHIETNGSDKVISKVKIFEQSFEISKNPSHRQHFIGSAEDVESSARLILPINSTT
jgi:hypothetical protein